MTTVSVKNSARSKLKQISGFVDPDTKAAFTAAAAANGHSESSLVNVLVNFFLKKNPVAAEALPLVSHVKERRLGFRLTSAEQTELKNRAATRGMKPAQYIRHMFRAHITKSPHFYDDDLTELREANRQLAAIGKNINQIVKALNKSLDNAHLAYAIDLTEMRRTIEDHRQTIVTLVRENMRSWGVEDENGNE